MPVITTTFGRQVNLQTFSEEDVDIFTIAHALSNLCRFGGHCREFYSVAQHSVYVAECLRCESHHIQQYALLHDAAEAYLVDLPRPLKRALPQYKEWEERIQTVIYSHFGLPAPDEFADKAVALADNMVLRAEMEDLTNFSQVECKAVSEKSYRPTPVSLIVPWHRTMGDNGKNRFLLEFERLFNEKTLA